MILQSDLLVKYETKNNEIWRIKYEVWCYYLKLKFISVIIFLFTIHRRTAKPAPVVP